MNICNFIKKMNILSKLENFVTKTFKTTLDVFLDAIKMSPNAQGYVNGSITELLLKQHLEKFNFEAKRIKEKWEGEKHSNHKGDLYFKKNGTNNWYVLESKGVKSNTEDWNKLYNYNTLKNFFINNSEIISWINQEENIENQVINWIEVNLPEFTKEGRYSIPLYKFNEIQKYVFTERKSAKREIMANLIAYTRDEINVMIEERIKYLQTKVRVLDTHLVSGTSKSNDREQNTPRKDEFNILSVDIALRYTEHKFYFTNPKNLDSSTSNEFHLQQNYIMGFIFTNANGEIKIDLTDDWYENFDDAFNTLSPNDSINENEMQIDNRNIIIVN